MTGPDEFQAAMEAELKASRMLIRAVVVNRLPESSDDYRLYQRWAAASARCSLALVARRTHPTEEPA